MSPGFKFVAVTDSDAKDMTRMSRSVAAAAGAGASAASLSRGTVTPTLAGGA